ncbi:four helix bundle protein [Candidatus Microgenomates bacterium]|jgi:four helix bundle protein|nr:MAG: four helix bundle protein [Candidatus Microgenomates bacterium]
MNKVSNYKDLIVWQKAKKLAIAIFELTENFPKSEIYGLVSQMRRCSVSIPSNIAEGSRRGSKKDYCQFLRIAFGSGAELETQIEILKELSFGKNLNYEKVDSLLEEVMKMLNKLINQFTTNYNLPTTS